MIVYLVGLLCLVICFIICFVWYKSKSVGSIIPCIDPAGLSTGVNPSKLIVYTCGNEMVDMVKEYSHHYFTQSNVYKTVLSPFKSACDIITGYDYEYAIYIGDDNVSLDTSPEWLLLKDTILIRLKNKKVSFMSFPCTDKVLKLFSHISSGTDEICCECEHNNKYEYEDCIKHLFSQNKYGCEEYIKFLK